MGSSFLLYINKNSIHPFQKKNLQNHICYSHYFHIIGDNHQPNSRGLYTLYKGSLLKVG